MAYDRSRGRAAQRVASAQRVDGGRRTLYRYGPQLYGSLNEDSEGKRLAPPIKI